MVRPRAPGGNCRQPAVPLRARSENETTAATAAAPVEAHIHTLDRPERDRRAPVVELTRGNRYVAGLATTWSRYEINNSVEGHFLEEVQRGATLKTISERMSRIRVQWNHGRDTLGAMPVARLVELYEDEVGLRYTAELFPSPHRDQLAAALASGQIGSSMSFRAIREDYNPRPPRSEGTNGLPLRVLKEISISELGPVLYPANPAATAGLRAA